MAETDVIRINRFGFGTRVRDRLTGYRGYVTARTDYPKSESKYEVVSDTLASERPVAEWFSESRLETDNRSNGVTP